MNDTIYDLERIRNRVAALEEDCHEEIQAKADVTMTATVIPEARWLLDQVYLKCRGDVDPAVKAIEDRVARLESKLASAVEIGKFVRLNTSIVTDMRHLLDVLDKLPKKKPEAA